MSTPLDTVRAYHQRTKHQLRRYANGPENLDWDAQPEPFRQWAGAPLTPLPLVADTVATPWADLFQPNRVAPQPVNLNALGLLFELSFGLTAWKQYGPSRWALRANPSSGNLHPTEVYLVAHGIADLHDGLYHYAPREHALSLRAASPRVSRTNEVPALWVGLSSIQWREAWKYGERAFRYCELDAGHAVGALRYAAAVMDWQAHVMPHVPHTDLATLLGLDRAADFAGAEQEEAELLIQVGPQLMAPTPPSPWVDATVWSGQASLLDAHPMYQWPVIDEVIQATRRPEGEPPDQATHGAPQPAPDTPGAPAPRSGDPATTLIRERRSAQHFNPHATLSAEAFFRMAQALMPQQGLPWDAWPHVPRVHPVLYAHRVDGLAPGAYALPRTKAGERLLRDVLQMDRDWVPVPNAPAGLPLFCLITHPGLAGALRTLSCHQAIGHDACFAVSLLAEFDPLIEAGPWHYRELFQEAGLIGQALYLQAEAEGYQGTGIGCYFDDAVHDILGMTDQRLQVLYQFTVGQALVDTRIRTGPPYAHRFPGSQPS